MNGVTVALKIDVATYSGLQKGVPAILNLLKNLGIKATFYFALGPDNTGKSIRRIFLRKGTLTNAVKGPWRYDIKSILYGILLPPPIIGRKFAATILQAKNEGHEIGVHCWDHVKWYDLLPYLPKPVTAMELGRAAALFQEITGGRAMTTAAPGWMVSADSLEIQDAMRLSHCSDTRGTSPFYPVLHQRRFSTLQIPTTWPTLDEIICEGIKEKDLILNNYLSRLTSGLHVHTIQADLEGGRFLPFLTELLSNLRERGVKFSTLTEVATAYSLKACHAEIASVSIPGRSGKVAVQGEFIV